MKTALERIFEKHDKEFDKMNFLRWLSDNRKSLLEAEKEQIIDASVQANLRYDTGANEPVVLRYCNDAEQYYQITFKSD